MTWKDVNYILPHEERKGYSGDIGCDSIFVNEYRNILYSQGEGQVDIEQVKSELPLDGKIMGEFFFALLCFAYPRFLTCLQGLGVAFEI